MAVPFGRDGENESIVARVGTHPIVRWSATAAFAGAAYSAVRIGFSTEPVRAAILSGIVFGAAFATVRQLLRAILAD